MHKKLRINNKPLYTAASAVFPYSKALETHFMVNTKYDPDPVFLAKKVGDYLLVPREMAPLAEDDRRSHGSPIKITMKIPPRDEKQEALIANSLELLKQGKSHTLQALMGFGKTFCAIHLMCQVGVTTLIIVTKEDLMTQWHENLLKYTDIKEEEIGICQQNICQYTDKKVVIAMIHSLACVDYPSNFYEWAGFVIWDECITGDAAITLADGSTIPLVDLVTGFEQRKTYSVLSYNEETKQVEPKAVTNVWRKGKKKIVKLTFANGRMLKCTEDHLLFTSNRGWVAAKDLIGSDDILDNFVRKSHNISFVCQGG